MAGVVKESIFGGVDFHAKSNNFNHRTSEISPQQLIVRRGKPFQLSLTLKKAFRLLDQPIIMTAMTGKYPSEQLGTISTFSIPDPIRRSPNAKAVWMIAIQDDDTEKTGKLTVNITPPPDCPIGEYEIMVKHKEEETLLATLVVLFNPWCSEDTVFLSDDKERNEYVMNENGVIFIGSSDYIFPIDWDFGQFESNMVDICLRILDLNPKNTENPAKDVASRSDPIYVSRLISAMVNSNDDYGVLVGRWSGDYEGGERPGYWTGSHQILKKWFVDKKRVKFGQCWVFAGVMCAVMRLLGIPTRVISNFASAHDTNQNLTIDKYYDEDGIIEERTHDSIWNFHVWVESWMKRPDLSKSGMYDGWQVVDPTPQERSEGVFCCGPASVKAIFKGETPLPYDLPFVFAEVNADVIDWKIKPDGSKEKLNSDTKRVGKNISTKAVGSDARNDVTSTYKHKEGSDNERAVFKYAVTRDYSVPLKDDEEMEEEGEEEGETEGSGEGEESGVNINVEDLDEGHEGEGEAEDSAVEETNVDDEDETSTLSITALFQEVNPPTKGKDVSMRLVLLNKSSDAMSLSISISVAAMRYNGTLAGRVQKEKKEGLLQSKKALSFPFSIKFSDYRKFLDTSDSLKVTVMVTDKANPNSTYMTDDDIVLLDPSISVTVQGPVKQYRVAKGEVIFMNPIKETLKNCSLALSGSGLWSDEMKFTIPDIEPNRRLRVSFSFIPYKTGKKTLVVDFDCSVFRDIKGHCKVNVRAL